MKPFLLDASALIAAAIPREAGNRTVIALMRDNPGRVHIHAVNLAEVYCRLIRKRDATFAESWLAHVRFVGIRVEEVLDEPIWKDAAWRKAQYSDLSMADAIAIATAIKLQAKLVGRDTAAFDGLGKAGVVELYDLKGRP